MNAAAVPALAVTGGVVRANSRDVAATFEKEHRNVLRAIDDLIAVEPSLTLLNFEQGLFLNPRGERQEHRCFDMDRDGFSLLAMGFTGPKALKWKLAYIRAFNAMEEALRARPDPVETLEDVSEADDAFARRRQTLVELKEIRVVFGARAARKAWLSSGLLADGVVDAEHQLLPVGVIAHLHQSIAEWMEARTVAAQGHREYMQTLYGDYVSWARGEGLAGAQIVSMTSFGRTLSQCGVAAGKSDRMYRLGLKLID